MQENTIEVINISELFNIEQHEIQLSVNGFERSKASNSESEIIIDDFPLANGKCVFLRLAKNKNQPVQLTLPGNYLIESCPSGGWILIPKDKSQPSFWIPVQPKLRTFDANAHVLTENDAEVSDINMSTDTTSISYFIKSGYDLNIVIWRFTSSSNTELNTITSYLSAPSILETQAYYLWGSHTAYRRPADIYLHLIYGYIYENNYAWPRNWKICSENDAHALYVVLSGLDKATKNPIYLLLKNQILLSVIARQEADGAWRHGEWTDHMEAHFRLNASAIHMLMDAWEEYNDPMIKRSLLKAVEYISHQRDTLDCGVWFLHDDLELSVEKMRNAPFAWLSSKALGKSTPNMLVLNTHIDITILLDRYRKLIKDSQYDELIASANNSTKTALLLKPAETLYKIVFSIINLSLLPSDKATALPLYLRALKRIGWKYLIPRLHHLKVRFPRFVMPGGYIDRAIPLHTWAFHYLTINIMDLLRHKRSFNEAYQDKIIEDALQYTYYSGVLEKWQELEYEKYALGFWAEALYHQCTLSLDFKYRKWLAEAILILEKMGIGIPPSLLGSNSEAITFSSQTPCPLPSTANLRIVNLCRENNYEYIVVNSGDANIGLTKLNMPSDSNITWFDKDRNQVELISTDIPAFSWLHGIYSNSHN